MSTHPDHDMTYDWPYTLEAGVVQETIEDEPRVNDDTYSTEVQLDTFEYKSFYYHYHIGQLFRICASSYISIFIVNWIDGWMLKVPYINNYTDGIQALTTTQNITRPMVLEYSPYMFIYQICFLFFLFSTSFIFISQCMTTFVKYPISCVFVLMNPFIFYVICSFIMYINDPLTFEEYYLSPSFLLNENDTISSNKKLINGTIYIFPYPKFEDYQPKTLMERLLYRVNIQHWSIFCISLIVSLTLCFYCGCILKEKYDNNIERVLQTNLQLTRIEENETRFN